MKTIMLMALFLLSGLFGSVAQTPKCPEDVKYDRFKDQTTEVCTSLILKRTGLDLFGITPNISYKGTRRQAPIKVSFLIISQRGAVGRVLQPEYSDVKVLYLLTNLGRAEVPVTLLTPTGPKRDMILEGLIAELTPVALSVLIDAEKGEGRIGATEFQFNESSLRSFQNVLREVQPLLSLPKPPLTRKSVKTKL